MRAIQLTAYGNPVEVLEFADVPEPGAPGIGQALVAVEFAPLDLSDLRLARGGYPVRPILPAVIGNEGVGRVIAVGADVSHIAIGDRVLLPLSSMSWRERLLVPAGDLFALPASIDAQQAAMLGVNPPTAALLLSEFVSLQRGDWIVQNAANSGVGRWVIAFARRRGLRTINIVRRQELEAEIKALGGDVVLVDGPDVVTQIKAVDAERPLRLALDGVSGAATAVLAAALSPYGTIAAYSAMSGTANALNPLDVIFKPLALRGFFMGHNEYAAKIPPLLREAADMLATGTSGVPIAAVYPLERITEAVAHVQRGGKVLLQVAATGAHAP